MTGELFQRWGWWLAYRLNWTLTGLGRCELLNFNCCLLIIQKKTHKLWSIQGVRLKDTGTNAKNDRAQLRQLDPDTDLTRMDANMLRLFSTCYSNVNLYECSDGPPHSTLWGLFEQLWIIIIMNNYAWMSPRPLAPTATSYWLWHAATLPRCLPASRSLCLSSCRTSTNKARLQQSGLIFSQKKKISAVPRPQQTQQSFCYGNRPDLGKVTEI